MNPKIHVLLIEDDPGTAAGLEHVLSDEDYRVTVAARGDTGLELGRTLEVTVVVTDLKLPGLDGLQLIRQLHSARPQLPIILMTAHGTTETAIEATKLGAFDYLLKPFTMEELIDLIGKAAAASRLTSGVELGETVSDADAIVGTSRTMQNIYKEIGRVAAKPVTVLVRGETGTGKELVARALYQHSERAQAPFVAINCAAIPETLLESELFGHERGAFTGAEARRIGRFEQAHGGTLFLDEIGDLGLSTQAKLLRVLQERSIQRLGGKESIPVDVRIIAATHRDLEQAIAEKAFREDLFYRLSVVVINLPPLRQRAEDLPALIKYFLRRYGAELGIAAPSIVPEAIEYLRTLPWPGNVRELENVMRQAMLLARAYPINLDHVRQVISRGVRPASATSQPIAGTITELLAAAKRGEADEVYSRVMEGVERELFTQAIQAAGGNQAKAARWLGVSRITMREKLNRFGLRTPAQGPDGD